MTLRTVAVLACAVGVWLASAPRASAQSRTGTTLGQFLLIEPSARLTGIGNAGSAGDGELEGAYYNPAAAARLTKLEFQLTHINWLADIRYDHLVGAVPLGSWGTGFASLTSLNSGEIDVRTVNQPLGTGERFSVSDFALGLGLARAITDRFSAGLQVKYFQETVWHTSADAVTFDVGSVYRIAPDGLHIGSSISNFGTGAAFSGHDLRITYDGDPTRNGDNPALPGERFVQSYAVPVLFRVAAGMPWRVSPDWRMWFAAEARHPNSNSESVNLGAEGTYRNLLSVRAGYQSLFQQDSEEGLTLGAGIRGQLESFDYRIDYAWADHGRLGDVHRLSLGLLH